MLAGRPNVSDTARRSVLAAAERLHYRPNAMARGLRAGRSASIGVLISDLGNPVFMPFLKGVEHLAGIHDLSVLIADGQRSGAAELRAVESFAGRRIEALIVAGPLRNPASLEAVRATGLPVLTERDFDTDRHADEAVALRAACDALADAGHRRVALCGRRRGAGARRRGVLRRSLEARGVEVEELEVPEASIDETARRLRATSATALFSTSHPLTPDLLAGLVAAEMRIPGDVSVITVGDSPWAAAYNPPLAVVRRDVEAEGQAAVARVVALLGRTGVPEVAVAPAVFVPRRSLGPPRPHS